MNVIPANPGDGNPKKKILKDTGTRSKGELTSASIVKKRVAELAESEERIKREKESEFLRQFMNGNMDPKAGGEEAEMMGYIAAARRAVTVLQKATELVKKEVDESEKEAEGMMEELARLRAELEAAQSTR